MNDFAWTSQEEVSLTSYLVGQIASKASGRSETECLRNYPRDVYFIGNLRPLGVDPPVPLSEPRGLDQLLNKLAPVAFGAEFRLPNGEEPVIIVVSLRWSCYYRMFPTFLQQRDHQSHQNVDQSESVTINNNRTEFGFSDSGENDDTPTTGDTVVIAEEGDRTAEADSPDILATPIDRRRTRIPQDSLFIRFRKVSCSASGRIVLTRNTETPWTTDTTDLQEAVDQELRRVQEVIVGDSESIRTSGSAVEKVRVPESSLISEATFGIFLRSLRSDVIPEWCWRIRSEVYGTASSSYDSRVLSLEFVNATRMAESAPNTEAFLFDTEFSAQFTTGEVLPFELDLAPQGFRYDRHVWGRGINCAVVPQREGSPVNTFVTVHMPVYQQLRFKTRTRPAAAFADLARNPLPVLVEVLQAMEQYREVWIKERRRFVESSPNWESVHGSEFERDRLRFENEIARFRTGLEFIRSNPDVQSAFQLTNETFRRGSKTEWRLFQIVFLVCQIPGIVALQDPSNSGIQEREDVDIIYFPTGGGKTEAYLATIVFHCFFDRMRGKTAGVTAWTRFPLRLLTLQQTQRVADVIGTAEIVRLEQRDTRLSGRNVDGFAVGYFVGQGGSPNEIVNPLNIRYAAQDAQVTWSKVNDPVARQEWKRVAKCPSCKTYSVIIDFDAINTRLIHRCNNPECRFPGGIIPVYVVDNEVFRYLPAVIVGTIDKLAGIGNQRKFALLFGQVDGICTQHGYFKGRCCQKDCTNFSLLQTDIPSGLSGPTLFVQDELHLLKEGLGTFDAHYETFTQRLMREFGQNLPLKIIASSATIEAFARQINHLYGRSIDRAKIFPGLGPTLNQSFYAETMPHPQRLYSGVIPHNKTIFNAVLELIDLYHREIQSLQVLTSGAQNPYGGALLPGTADWERLLDLYATSLTYFLASRELNSIRTDLEGDVIPRLQRDGLLALDISELTGSTATDAVSRVLEKLERPAIPGVLPDAVLATSMVSHGVDVDRFNAMIFYGMPRQNAEYIQASSRVGRTHVGIVFACLHPVRERDQSHYSFFLKFHEFLGQLVEPVAINRWSKFSINHTLPGLFMGVLLQIIANRSSESNPNRYYMLDFVRGKISDGTLRPENFIPLIEEAYGVQNPSTLREVAFRDEIRLRIRQYFDWILSPAAGMNFVSDILIPKPMRSLRDVDEVIPIELDSMGSQWVARAGRQ